MSATTHRFVKYLQRPIHSSIDWPRMKPKKGEISLLGGVTCEWKFPDTEQVLASAYKDFSVFLARGKIKRSEAFRIVTEKEPSLKSEEHRIIVSRTECKILASDSMGIRTGLIFLEELLLKCGGPFLRLGAVERSPFVRWRISRCCFGPIKRPPFNHDELLDNIDYYPDAYLNRLAHEGTNGLWLTVRWRDLCKTSFEVPDKKLMECRLEKLRRVVDKCKRYGIKIWAFCIEPVSFVHGDSMLKRFPQLGGAPYYHKIAFCPSSKDGQRYIYESVRFLFSQVPDLGGMINISHGERGTTCLSSIPATEDGDVQCPRCNSIPKWQIMNHTLTAMRNGMRDATSKAELISWLYMPQEAPRARWVFDLARHVPEGVTLQYNFESGGAEKQLGKVRRAGDYWLSYVGPGPDFARLTKLARSRKTNVSAKLQVGCALEIATVPFVPVPGILYDKYKAMQNMKVSRAMQCWFWGAFPGIMNRAAGHLGFEKFKGSKKKFLNELAVVEWGIHASTVVRAWQYFEKGYRHYPLCNMFQYYGPMHDGVTWPLHLEVNNAPLSPVWKPDFPISGDTIGECLRNHTLEEVLSLVGKLCSYWQKGFSLLNKLRHETKLSYDQQIDINLAEALNIQFNCGRNILDFYLKRRQWFEGNGRSHKLLQSMESIVRQEITNRIRLIELVRHDLRLGFQAEAETYRYDPKSIGTAIKQLQKMLIKDFPKAYLQKNEAKCSFIKNPPLVYKVNSGWANSKTYRWRADSHRQNIIFTVDDIAPSSNATFSLAFMDQWGTCHPRYVSCCHGKLIANTLKEGVFTAQGNGWKIVLSRKSLFRFGKVPSFQIMRVENAIEDHSPCERYPEDQHSINRIRLNLGYFNPQVMGALQI